MRKSGGSGVQATLMNCSGGDQMHMVVAGPLLLQLGIEGHPSWPALAAQVDGHCGSWGPFPYDMLEMEWTVEVKERSSVGDLTGERSACRSTMTSLIFLC
jgi:hypothetical protein